MAKINLYDRAMKVLSFHYSDLALKLAFPDQAFEVLDRQKNVENPGRGAGVQGCRGEPLCPLAPMLPCRGSRGGGSDADEYVHRRLD